jgi:hypothetical protein
VEFGDESKPFWEMEQALPISAGDSVNVTFNDTKYELIAQLFPGDSNVVYFGNDAMFGGPDNKVPFAAITGYDGETEFLSIIAPDFAGQSVPIKVESNIIHTIDPKFIPDGVGGEAIIVRDSAAASGIATMNAAPTATMNAAEIMKAVNAGKAVYFLDENRADPRLLPFKEAYRIDELATGIMPAAGLPDPYVLFGRTNEYGFDGIKVFLTGEYWGVYADFSNDGNITDISVSG